LIKARLPSNIPSKGLTNGQRLVGDDILVSAVHGSFLCPK